MLYDEYTYEDDFENQDAIDYNILLSLEKAVNGIILNATYPDEILVSVIQDHSAEAIMNIYREDYEIEAWLNDDGWELVSINRPGSDEPVPDYWNNENLELDTSTVRALDKLLAQGIKNGGCYKLYH